MPQTARKPTLRLVSPRGRSAKCPPRARPLPTIDFLGWLLASKGLAPITARNHVNAIARIERELGRLREQLGLRSGGQLRSALPGLLVRKGVRLMMYALRDVPEDLWERVKARATREGHRLREVMLQLLEYYAAAGLPESPRETAKGLDLAAAGDAKAIRDYPKRIRPDWELQAAWWVGYIRGSSDTVAVRAELKEAFERIARGDHLQNHS